MLRARLSRLSQALTLYPESGSRAPPRLLTLLGCIERGGDARAGGAPLGTFRPRERERAWRHRLCVRMR
eukprot:6214048-Pleurochrysis_carterae.AAC.2